MPQYYSVLDNGQKPVKEKAMAKMRKNQNVNRQGGKKVNYRMREGANYYGDVTAKKKESSFGKAEAGRMGGAKPKAPAKKKNPYVDDTSRKMRGAPSKNYKKGLYR